MEDCKVSQPSATSQGILTPKSGKSSIEQLTPKSGKSLIEQLTPKSGKSLIEQVGHIVNCGVCYGVQAPLMLKCSHLLCGSCWEKLKLSAKDNRVGCPFCRFSLSVHVPPTRVRELDNLARVYAKATKVPLAQEDDDEKIKSTTMNTGNTTDHKLAVAKDMVQYSAELLADGTYHKVCEMVSPASFVQGFIIHLPKFSSVTYVKTLFLKFTQNQCFVTFRNSEMAIRTKQQKGGSSASCSSSFPLTLHVFIALDGTIESISSKNELFSFHSP